MFIPGHNAPDPGHNVPDPGHNVPDPGHNVQSPGHNFPDAGHNVRDPSFLGCRILLGCIAYNFPSCGQWIVSKRTIWGNSAVTRVYIVIMYNGQCEQAGILQFLRPEGGVPRNIFV